MRATTGSRASRRSGDGKAVLAARVRAVPEDGAANAALEKLLAKAAGCRQVAVSVTSGHTQRVKILRHRRRGGRSWRRLWRIARSRRRPAAEIAAYAELANFDHGHALRRGPRLDSGGTLRINQHPRAL
jgi:uncharacterized protein YggU (UPF0235/DUF167 family)